MHVGTCLLQRKLLVTDSPRAAVRRAQLTYSLRRCVSLHFKVFYACRASHSHHAQVVEKKDLEHINWTRNLSFTAFGFAYLGGVQYYLCTWPAACAGFCWTASAC